MRIKPFLRFLIFLIAAQSYAKQYMHNTGRTSVIVDDNYCGGFYYHNMLRTDELDNLWRAFLAVRFNEFGRNIPMGIGNDYGATAETIFVKLCTLEVYIDSSNIQSYFAYIDSTTGLKVEQWVNSMRNNQYWIFFSFRLTNTTSRTLTDGRLLFFYDGDIPADDFYNDFTGVIQDHNVVFEYDPIKRVWTGFTFLFHDYRVWCGNYEDWYYRGRTIDALLEIINNPVWDNTIMNMDCAVYEVIELGNLPPRSSTPELKFAFVTGESLKQLEQSVAETWGESTYVEIQSGKVSPKISLYPAPANQNLTVQYPLDLPAEIEILDINGRKVFQKEIAPKSRVIVDISIYPPGLLFFRITNSKEIFTGKIIHLK